ncbi:hypothetical protein [Klebsiella quasipneumoniae]|uniref:hypothetical protein n=1 Tax=Klebsiella quasipneumoniae TaxID=1463165 RepID=UPI002380EA88|nr:hypothetical protein [Klebsiella quasipneumoniae]MDE4644957.1 hypothetical protein [Klebsiella quasipneumoniae subsp. similipneumoniae]
MPHQVATKNMTNKMIILYLALTGITGLVYGLCSLSGETLHSPFEISSYDAVAGDLIEHSLYTFYKPFVAILCSLVIPLIWLLSTRKTTHRKLRHPVIPVMLSLLIFIFFGLFPGVIPGGDTTRYRYFLHDKHYLSIVWASMDPDNYFESRSHYETYIEYRDPYGFRRIDNIKNAYHCEQTRETVFLTLYISQRWFPKGKPDVLEAQCQKITDANTLTEAVLAKAYWFPFVR